MVSEYVDGDMAVQHQLDGETSGLLIEIGFQEFFKGWLRWQKCSVGGQFCAGGKQLSAGFSLKWGLYERPLLRKSC